MNEKHVAGFGGGLIIISLLLIVVSPVFDQVKDEVFVKGGTPGFTQLGELKDEAKAHLQNNTALDDFRELVGNVTDDMSKNVKTNIHQTFSDM